MDVVRKLFKLYANEADSINILQCKPNDLKYEDVL